MMTPEELAKITPEPTDAQKILSRLDRIVELLEELTDEYGRIHAVVEGDVEVHGSVTSYDPR